MVKITIRDGRDGCELAPDGKGAVLGTIERRDFLDIGDKIELHDGTATIVIGLEESLYASGDHEQFVSVGSMPEQKAS